jgi:NADH pyrophosphatase NudC (nudix superfamily)
MLNPIFKQKNADWRYCPRCNTPTVEKENRWCRNCKSRLFFQGDDCQYAVDRKDGYYIWLTSINKLTGWFYMNYQG